MGKDVFTARYAHRIAYPLLVHGSLVLQVNKKQEVHLKAELFAPPLVREHTHTCTPTLERQIPEGKEACIYWSIKQDRIWPASIQLQCLVKSVTVFFPRKQTPTPELFIIDGTCIIEPPYVSPLLATMYPTSINSAPHGKLWMNVCVYVCVLSVHERVHKQPYVHN